MRDIRMRKSPQPRPRRNRSRLIGFHELEPRLLFANTSPDLFSFQSGDANYDQTFFVEQSDPVAPRFDDSGKAIYNFRQNQPGDQTAALPRSGPSISDPKPDLRFLVDPVQSYRIVFLSANEDTLSWGVRSFDTNGRPLSPSTGRGEQE
jgi:hypothetical protein